MRTTGAEPWLALGGHARRGQRALLGLDHRQPGGDAGAHIGRQIELLQPRGDGLGDDRRGQLVVGRQQPVVLRDRPFAARVVSLVELAVHLGAHVVAPVVQLLLERVFHDLALFLDHEDFLQPLGELARAVRFQRPHAAHLVEADAQPRAGLVIEAEVGQRLAGVEVGLAGGHDAETRVRRVDLDPVELVGAHIGQAGVPLVVKQARFLIQRRVGPADVQAALRQDEVVGQHDLHAVGVQFDRGRRFHHVGHALHGHPEAGVAAHRPAVQAVVEVFLDVGRVEHGQAAGLEDVLGLVRQRGGLGRMVVAG
ncbi:hypothetical protein D3C87_1224830 [compost metagenome]